MAYIADTVHYVESIDGDEPVCRAAIVTAHGIEEGEASLSVFVGSQPYIVDGIGYAANRVIATWHRGAGVDCPK